MGLRPSLEFIYGRLPLVPESDAVPELIEDRLVFGIRLALSGDSIRVLSGPERFLELSLAVGQNSTIGRNDPAIDIIAVATEIEIAIAIASRETPNCNLSHSLFVPKNVPREN